MKKIEKVFSYIIMLLGYWISFLFSPEKNLWIFGAWFGDSYSDNSKYLFEYITNSHPEINAIWITKNKEVFYRLKKLGLKVVMMYSIKGFYYTMRAKIGVISVGHLDLGYATSHMKLIQLWHGMPFKKINLDDQITFKPQSNTKRMMYSIFPFLKTPYDLLATSSEEAQKIYCSAFGIPKNNAKITGCPRNDSFFQESNYSNSLAATIIGYKHQGRKIAIYMPTHRNEGKLNLGDLLLSNFPYINKELQKMDCILLVKLHPYHNRELDTLKSDSFENIIIVKDEMIEQDIYSVLSMTDILLTDYSSVYLDYLLTDKPIIFTPFDIQDYIKIDREFYYDYETVAPGPKAHNWKEVMEYLEMFLIKKIDNYQEHRYKTRIRFHKYEDGNSSRRVFDEINNLTLS